MGPRTGMGDAMGTARAPTERRTFPPPSTFCRLIGLWAGGGKGTGYLEEPLDGSWRAASWDCKVRTELAIHYYFAVETNRPCLEFWVWHTFTFASVTLTL